MRHIKLITLLPALLLLCGLGHAADEAGLQKISEHVYAYVGTTDPSPATGFGANAGVVIGKDAALVVDTLMTAKMGKKFLSDIRKITDKPVKYVVNTHYHLDHAWGNCVFAQNGAIILGHDGTRLATPKAEASLKTAGATYGLNEEALAGTTIVPPSVSFSGTMTVDLGGGVLVELSMPGPSHTDGSITASIPSDKVLFTGDIVFNKYHPFMGEGDLANWPKTLDALSKQTPDDTKIIPGHGPVGTKAVFAEMRDYILAFDKEAKRLCAGKTQADSAAIAQEMLKVLPDQGRTLTMMVESNLKMRYLAAPAK